MLVAAVDTSVFDARFSDAVTPGRLYGSKQRRRFQCRADRPRYADEMGAAGDDRIGNRDRVCVCSLHGNVVAADRRGGRNDIDRFLLCAVGGYLVGLVGSSNQPLSGLTLSSLILSALLLTGFRRPRRGGYRRSPGRRCGGRDGVLGLGIAGSGFQGWTTAGWNSVEDAACGDYHGQIAGVLSDGPGDSAARSESGYRRDRRTGAACAAGGSDGATREGHCGRRDGVGVAGNRRRVSELRSCVWARARLC